MEQLFEQIKTSMGHYNFGAITESECLNQIVKVVCEQIRKTKYDVKTED